MEMERGLKFVRTHALDEKQAKGLVQEFCTCFGSLDKFLFPHLLFMAIKDRGLLNNPTFMYEFLYSTSSSTYPDEDDDYEGAESWVSWDDTGCTTKKVRVTTPISQRVLEIEIWNKFKSQYTVKIWAEKDKSLADMKASHTALGPVLRWGIQNRNLVCNYDQGNPEPVPEPEPAIEKRLVRRKVVRIVKRRFGLNASQPPDQAQE